MSENANNSSTRDMLRAKLGVQWASKLANEAKYSRDHVYRWSKGLHKSKRLEEAAKTLTE